MPGVGNGSFVTGALDSVTGEADSFGSPQNHVVGIALLGALPTTIKMRNCVASIPPEDII